MRKHPFLTESDNKTKEHNVDALNYLKFEVLPVLVRLSCRRRVPQTGWFMETEIRFSQFWKSTFRFWWGPSSRLQTATCSRIRTWWEEGASSAPSWTQFMRPHPPWPNHLPEAPPPHPTTLGVGFQHMRLGWDRISVRNILYSVLLKQPRDSAGSWLRLWAGKPDLPFAS